MPDQIVTPWSETRARPARPPLYRVLLLNDDYTPREFVIGVLRRVFRLKSDQARRVMVIAHTRGMSIVAVYTRDVAETKAAQATDQGRREDYPLTFTIEPEPSENAV